MVLDPSPPPFWGIPLRLFNKHSTRRSKERPIYTKRDLQKRPTKETLNNPGEIPLYFFDSTLAASAPMCQNRLYTSKETCKRDLQTNPTKETCKETYKRDLQQNPTKETWHDTWEIPLRLFEQHDASAAHARLRLGVPWLIHFLKWPMHMCAMTLLVYRWAHKSDWYKQQKRPIHTAKETLSYPTKLTLIHLTRDSYILQDHSQQWPSCPTKETRTYRKRDPFPPQKWPWHTTQKTLISCKITHKSDRYTPQNRPMHTAKKTNPFPPQHWPRYTTQETLISHKITHKKTDIYHKRDPYMLQKRNFPTQKNRSCLKSWGIFL